MSLRFEHDRTVADVVADLKMSSTGFRKSVEECDHVLRPVEQATGFRFEIDVHAASGFVFKCLQLYEVLVVRHGVMFIGESMVGKSTIRTSLNAALIAGIARHDKA